MSNLGDMPAHPGYKGQDVIGNYVWQSGMTLRQYYAGLALPEAMRRAESVAGPEFLYDAEVYRNASRIALEQADVLIAKLEAVNPERGEGQ